MANRYKASILSSTAATSTTSAASGVWKLSDIAQAVTAGLWPIVAAIGDALFNYVSLLLPFTNTNGRTNNTFLDSSTNNFTITRNGTATQGTFSPFSQTGWSGYFNGSTDYLTAPSDAAFAVGTVFTVELWVWPTTTTNMVTLGALGIGWNGASQWGVANVGVAWVVTSSTMPTQSAWNHIAIVRTGTGTNQTEVYLNGVSVAVGTYTPALTTSTIAYIGSGAAGASTLGGYISNLRIVKGTAVYTAAFTPPTAPLTAITNTSLLALQDNRFKDNSTNAFAITPTGTPSIQAFSPFLPTAEYQSETSGGAGYFGTKTDTLSITSVAALANFTGDFTIEAWVYPTDTTLTNGWGLVDARQAGGTTGSWIFNLVTYTSSGWLLSFFYGATNHPGSLRVLPNQWTHVAVVRSGSTISFFVNGALDPTTITASGTFTGGTSTVVIGSKDGGVAGYGTVGYVSNLRMVNGTAVYTTAFTPPTAPLTAITNTSLLTLQSSYFKDNSANAFTITTSGTPSVKAFTPFSQLGWSGLFNGANSDFLNTPTNTALLLDGSFTVECWVYLNSITSGGYFSSYEQVTTIGVLLGLNAGDGLFRFRIGTDATSGNMVTSTVAAATNTWYHLAGVLNGTTMTLYVNGVSVGTPATKTVTVNTSQAYIGRYYKDVNNFYTNGYISNLRVVKGTAVYTANFTPPTAPLTAITNTSLLTLQSSYFKDNSTNTFTITSSGAPSIRAVSPFASSSVYAATNGGTGYFNGTTDSLSAPANAAFSFTGDFTIEAWVYYTSVATEADIVSNYVSNVASDWTIVKPAAQTFQWYPSSAASFVNSGITPVIGTWYHIAAVRSGTTCSLYINGVSSGTPLTFSGTLGDAVKVVRVGARSASNYFPGYISGARIVKGTAVYTANFTPPTAPLAPIANTSLLLSGTNAGAIDNAAKNTAITNGSAQIATAISKWGGSSLLCSLAADKLTIPDTPLLRFGTGDFTVEGWFYLNFASALRNIVSKGNTTTTGWTVGVDSLNRIFATYTSTTLTGTVTTLAANTWYYFAMVRSGTATGNIKLYINGVLEASSATAITTDFNQTDALYIGSNRTGTTPAFDGYIDDIRITKAARTVTTTPTAAFSLQ